MKENKMPKVGVALLIFDHKGRVLLGKRKNAHGEASWAPPGGHLEFGESLENCAIREVLEETGLTISSPTFLAITNDFFEEEEKHYISIYMKAALPKDQEVQNLEPHKVENWEWFDLKNLPSPLFLSLQQLVAGNAYGLTDNFKTHKDY